MRQKFVLRSWIVNKETMGFAEEALGETKGTVLQVETIRIREGEKKYRVWYFSLCVQGKPKPGF